MWRQSRLEKASNGVSGPGDMDDFCDMAATLIKTDDLGYTFCYANQVFSSWRGMQFLTEGKEVANGEEDGEVEITEKEMFYVEQTPQFYT